MKEICFENGSKIVFEGDDHDQWKGSEIEAAVTREMRKRPIRHGQDLYGPDGSLWGVTGCASRQEAVEAVVGKAIEEGWKPPAWWQFWRKQWPKDCIAEFEHQSNE